MPFKDRARHLQYMKERRAKLREEGTCTRCWKNKTADGRANCDDCLEKARGGA